MLKNIYGAGCVFSLILTITYVICSRTWVRLFVLIHDGIEWLGFYQDKERECIVSNSFPDKLDEECVKILRETFHKRAI